MFCLSWPQPSLLLPTVPCPLFWHTNLRELARRAFLGLSCSPFPHSRAEIIELELKTEREAVRPAGRTDGHGREKGKGWGQALETGCWKARCHKDWAVATRFSDIEGTGGLGQSRVTVGGNQMGGGLLAREMVSRGVPTWPCPSFSLAQPSQSDSGPWYCPIPYVVFKSDTGTC